MIENIFILVSTFFTILLYYYLYFYLLGFMLKNKYI